MASKSAGGGPKRLKRPSATIEAKPLKAKAGKPTAKRAALKVKQAPGKLPAKADGVLPKVRLKTSAATNGVHPAIKGDAKPPANKPAEIKPAEIKPARDGDAGRASRKSAARHVGAKAGLPPPEHAKPAASKPGSRPITSFEEALDFLHTRTNVERTRPNKVDPAVFKLDRMRALLAKLGNPHEGGRYIHVAGSKGKGSTCEMIASCLAACGYTTGLYTSPHLVDVRERMRINGHMISKSDFAEFIAKTAAAARAVEREFGAATFFELTTAAAFLYFSAQAVDVSVIEVGLGGRLDSTNVITPDVAVVTAIQLEHTHLLGNTLEKIAAEKAGIFKPGVPAITIPQQKPSVTQVFRDAAQQVGCTLSVLGEDIEFSYRFEASAELGPHARICLTTPRSTFEHLPVPLRGEHQALNCGLALAAIDKLRERGFETPERDVATGLARTPNHGRLELIWKSPRIIVDGAHNPESIAGLVKAIGAHVRYDSMVVIFGCAADKDVAGMLSKIALGADKIIFTRAGANQRAMDPRELQRRFAEVSTKMTQIAPSLKDAINIAARAVGRDDLICVTGSFYLAGEAKKLLTEKAANAATQARLGQKSQAPASTRA